MALIPIVSIPDPVLRVVSEPVADVTDGVRKLLDDMADTMYDAPGIGLAAPQINISQRLIVMDCGPDDTRQLYKMINPEIVDASEESAI
ncbi:MAG: peptide deformylase, partial [Alphaproteobacteria bacterium]|nr:peptide deformylase [Alphaproteobacteria bacterium]